jgi:Integrase core domain
MNMAWRRRPHDGGLNFADHKANLRTLEVTEIKTVPYFPLSHPFVERLIGTVRREYPDRMLFWTTVDLERKLLEVQYYYNGHRADAGLGGRLPEPSGGESTKLVSLAETLPRVVPDADRRMNLAIRHGHRGLEIMADQSHRERDGR